MKNSLFSVPKDTYGEKYTDHVLEQYKLFVHTAEKTSERRMDVHKYFATLNAALLPVLGLTMQFGNYQSRMSARLIIALAGILASLVWWALVKSYKNLNSAKFGVIHQIEERLPLSLFSAEWKILTEGKPGGKHRPFSDRETWLPIAFEIGYIILLFWCLKWFIS